LAAALIALVVMSPWLVTVVGRHGIAPFVSAFGVGQRDLAASLVAYLFLFLVASPVIGLLDLAGQVHQGARRRPRLLAWRIGIFLLDLRYSPIAGAPVVAMLASVGAIEVVGAGVWRFVLRQQAHGNLERWRQGPVIAVVVGVALVGAMAPAVSRTWGLLAASAAAADREAMGSAGTPTMLIRRSGRFFARIGDGLEWFRRSQAGSRPTQGQEFAGVGAMLRSYGRLPSPRCDLTDADCVIDWIDRQGEGSSALPCRP
jgi:hypothetical protein